jgi:hypothetical protein
VSLAGSLVPVAALTGRLPDAQAAIVSGGKYDYVIEYDSLPAAPAATGDYYSAYVWVMFEAEQDAGPPEAGRRWLRLLPFFEHTNIADGGTYDFMREQLTRKALSFITRYRDASTRFRYVCAFDDPGHRGAMVMGYNRPTVREKIEELLARPEYGEIRDFVDVTPSDGGLVACQLPDLVAEFYAHMSAADGAMVSHERRSTRVGDREAG